MSYKFNFKRRLYRSARRHARREIFFNKNKKRIRSNRIAHNNSGLGSILFVITFMIIVIMIIGSMSH